MGVTMMGVTMMGVTMMGVTMMGVTMMGVTMMGVTMMYHHHHRDHLTCLGLSSKGNGSGWDCA